MKHYQKMRQRQRTCLDSMEGSVTWRDGVTTSVGGEAAPGEKREEMMLVRLTQILLDQKIKKIHMFEI
jgi:hypothetical protein